MMPKKLPRTFACVLAVLALPVFAACSSNESKSTPTAGASPSSAVTNAPATGTAAASVSPSGSPSATASAAPGGTGTATGGDQQTPWTVTPAATPAAGNVTLTDLRTGVHPEDGGFERIVFEFDGNSWPPATVQYVNQAVSCGKGEAVTVTGTAILEVAMTSAQAHDNSGNATVPAAITASGTIINGGIQSCDFEGHVTWDFGLNGKHNFTVSTLSNPPRIVVDVMR